MDKAILDMKTWAEAETWLSRHGYGPAQIEIQRVAWENRAKSSLEAAAVVEAKEPVVQEKVSTASSDSKTIKNTIKK